MKALVADDSPVMRRIVARTLNECGVEEIIQAGDGVDGWQQFQANTIDIVFTDSDMPQKSGVELVQQIRESGSNIPVVVISPQTNFENVQATLNDGVTEVLCRPFAPEALEETIRKVGSTC